MARLTPARAYVTLDELLKLDHRAQGFSFLPRQPVHSLLTGRHASRLRGRGLDFDELRHYSEGDDTRTIDWAATARLGTPYVRVYREERDRPRPAAGRPAACRCSSAAGVRRSRWWRPRWRRWRRSASPRSAIAWAASCFPSTASPRSSRRRAQAGVRRLLAALVRHNNALKADVAHAPDDPASTTRRCAARRASPGTIAWW